MFLLRDYQKKAVESVMNALDGATSRVLFTMPTGTGKTVVFSNLLTRLHERGDAPALVLAHRGELLRQAQDKLIKTSPFLSVDIEKAEQAADPGADVICASVQTIVRPTRLSRFQPRVIVVDEAHHATGDNSYQSILERFGAFDGRCFVVGCTATPKRLDKKALHTERGSIFQRVVFEYSIRQAIKEKHLCSLRGFLVHTDTDLSDVHTNAGDFAQDELADAIDDDERTSAVLDKWKEIAANRRTLAFCVNIAHACNVAAKFREAGITAEAVHGELPQKELTAIQRRFEDGETQVVANCQKWTEGVDIPVIDCILLMRPTKSWSLYVQMVGRGTRLSPGTGKKDCVVIDVVDNCGKHRLTTLPAVLDLPYDLDLEGQSLEDAADMMDELGERAGALISRRPQSFKEVKLMLSEVDLLMDIATPIEIESLSPYHWLRIPSGYLLTAPGNREIRMTQDALSNWLVTAKDPVNNKFAQFRAEEEDDFEKMLRLADDCATELFEDSIYLMKRNAKYRKDPASEKQLAVLRKFGIAPELIATFNKGQASAMITKMIHSRGR